MRGEREGEGEERERERETVCVCAHEELTGRVVLTKDFINLRRISCCTSNETFKGKMAIEFHL